MNHVEGYNERTEYDGPYHPNASFDPAVKFANSGDTKAAAKAAKIEEAERVEAEQAKQISDAERINELETRIADLESQVPVTEETVKAPEDSKA